jgi:hypothetical protein
MITVREMATTKGEAVGIYVDALNHSLKAITKKRGKIPKKYRDEIRSYRDEIKNLLKDVDPDIVIRFRENWDE